MLRTLLESKARAPRRRIAMTASIVAHIVLLTTLVMARTNVTAAAIEPIETRVVYFPPKQPDVPSRRTNEARRQTDRSRISLPPIAPLPDRAVDIPSSIGPIAPVRFAVGRVLGHDRLPSDVERTHMEVLTERTVDQPVELLPNQSPPRYPAALERAGVAGDVVVQFVVDTTGRVERASIDVQQTSHPEFARTVRERLTALRFVPARARGRLVRQLVEQQFRFEVVRR